MVHFVLDDLGGPALVELGAQFHFFVLEADLNGAVAAAFAGAAQQGEAAFFCFVGAGAADDLGVEHHSVRAAVFPEDDDALAHTDHVGGHTNAAGLMELQGVHQILRQRQVGFGGGLGLPGQENGIVDQRLDHGGLLRGFDCEIIIARLMEKGNTENWGKIKKPLDKRALPCYNTKAVWDGELNMGV